MSGGGATGLLHLLQTNYEGSVTKGDGAGGAAPEKGSFSLTLQLANEPTRPRVTVALAPGGRLSPPRGRLSHGSITASPPTVLIPVELFHNFLRPRRPAELENIFILKTPVKLAGAAERYFPAPSNSYYN